MVTACSLRVLLVEPEPLRAQVLHAILQGLDASCVLATTGFEGMQKLGTGTFDVVAVAETLPDMAGATFARTIRDVCGPQGVVLGLADGHAAHQAFQDAGVNGLMPAVPEFDGWMSCLRRVEARLADKGKRDRVVLEAWQEELGEELYDAVVRDYLEAGAMAMSRLHRAIARGDACAAASAARVFGSHSRAVGAGTFARAHEHLEDAFLRRDLAAAEALLCRLQDDWAGWGSALQARVDGVMT